MTNSFYVAYNCIWV